MVPGNAADRCQPGFASRGAGSSAMGMDPKSGAAGARSELVPLYAAL